MVHVVLLGPPGAGKGTQAPLLARAVGGGLLSTGELLRQAVRDGTPHGIVAAEYMDRGELVPDEIVLELVIERLAAGNTWPPFVLDGFPRNVQQARALDRALTASGQRVDHALSIDVARDILLERLRGRSTEGGPSARRSDDRPDVIGRRLDVYERQTSPVREYYRQRGVLREIDGNQPVADVTREILKTLGLEAATPDG